MTSKKIKLTFATAVIIALSNSIIYMCRYVDISRIAGINIHTADLTDALHGGTNVGCAIIANIAVLLIIFIVIRNPAYANYPGVISKKNKEVAYLRIRCVLAIVSVITSLSFFFIIITKIGEDRMSCWIVLLFITVAIARATFLRERKKQP